MKRKLAFTFIEVIIAITVFAIGVLAVLRLITQNLVTLDNTQMHTTATFLAKEWMELVYNMRDSNNLKLLQRDCVMKTDIKDITTDVTIGVNHQENVQVNACIWFFSSWTEDNNILQISFDPDAYMHVLSLEAGKDFNELRETNRLYYITWEVAWTELFRYSHQQDEWTETPFARYIRFASVTEGKNILPADRILKIESHVLYMKWTKTGEVILESFIWNY